MKRHRPRSKINHIVNRDMTSDRKYGAMPKHNTHAEWTHTSHFNLPTQTSRPIPKNVIQCLNSNVPNWKTLGPDQAREYWLIILQDRLATQLQDILEYPYTWLQLGELYSHREIPHKYRPITCLLKTRKLFSG